ncbi:MAG: phytanoyl-CoA dioxygenase family protein [Vicinamibacterales bacterium]
MSEPRRFFDRRGWLVLRGAVSAEPLKRITEIIDRLLEARADCGSAPSDHHGKSIWQIPGMCSQNDRLLAHVRDLGAVVADLLRADRIQLLQDTLIVKPPRVGAPIELHQDYTYLGFLEPPNAVSVRLSLSPSTVDAGCMYVIDRSHRWGLNGRLALFSAQLQQGVAERLPAPLRARIVKDRIPLELAPGDVSIHHCLTHHGSFENTGDTLQRTIVTHIIDGACRLLPDRLPDHAVHYFDTNADGHLSPTSFPVLFEREVSLSAQP